VLFNWLSHRRMLKSSKFPERNRPSVPDLFWLVVVAGL
jgi:hypothetical protein